MKDVKALRKALDAAFKHMCRTGDWRPYAEAFKALYGVYPVHLPQH